jgi:glyoxylase-like metal-dependent hydrolase (beta-lactamase superfamily II)
MLFCNASQAADLNDLALAMGTDKVKTIEFTAGGAYFHPGASALANEEWPKFKLVNLRQRINFETKSLALEMPLEQVLNPPRGAGFQPIKGLLVRSWFLKGDTAWTARRGKARPARSPARSQHWLWTSPHGLIKAAQESNSKVKLETVGSKKWNTLAVGKSGLFRAIGYFDVKENLLRKVEAQIAHEVLGDMSVVTLYTGYKTFDDVKHPARIIINYVGQTAFDLELNTVTPNAPADIEIPTALKPYEIKTTTEKVSDGIWYIRGGSHHSVAIELKDTVIVFEAPLSVARGEAVLKAVRAAIPKKKIRMVINSHHHFDHSGGLRAFSYQEIPILTHESNQQFYAEAYATARSIHPDPLSNTGIKARFLTMADQHKILDAERIIELHTLKGNPHAESNIIAYLPKEKMLIVADAYSSRKILEGPLPKDDVNPTQAHLWAFLQERNLDVETILPIHGKQVGIEQLRWAAGIGADDGKGDAKETPQEPAKTAEPKAEPAGDATDKAKPAGGAPEQAKPEGDATEQAKPEVGATEQAKPEGDAPDKAKPAGGAPEQAKPEGDASKQDVLNSPAKDVVKEN